MVSQVVDKIILAEKQAAEKVNSATEKSGQIISEASEKAKEIAANANQKSKNKAECILRNCALKIKEISENDYKVSLQKAAEIRAKALENKEKAIDIVIGKIISKQ